MEFVLPLVLIGLVSWVFDETDISVVVTGWGGTVCVPARSLAARALASRRRSRARLRARPDPMKKGNMPLNLNCIPGQKFQVDLGSLGAGGINAADLGISGSVTSSTRCTAWSSVQTQVKPFTDLMIKLHWAQVTPPSQSLRCHPCPTFQRQTLPGVQPSPCNLCPSLWATPPVTIASCTGRLQATMDMPCLASGKSSCPRHVLPTRFSRPQPPPHNPVPGRHFPRVPPGGTCAEG